MSAERRLEKLRPDHKIEGFDCGREELNRYLLRYEWQNQQASAAQTYVGLVGDSVIGYHTLAVGQVSEVAATLLRVTDEALYKAIELVRPGGRISDIGHTVQRHVEAYGLMLLAKSAPG